MLIPDVPQFLGCPWNCTAPQNSAYSIVCQRAGCMPFPLNVEVGWNIESEADGKCARPGLQVVLQADFIKACAPQHGRLASELLSILTSAGFLRSQTGPNGQQLVACDKAAASETAADKPVAAKARLEATAKPLEANITLIWACMQALPQILTGEVKVPDVMFPGGSAELVEPIYKNPLLSAPFNEQLALIVIDYVTDRLKVSVFKKCIFKKCITSDLSIVHSDATRHALGLGMHLYDCLYGRTLNEVKSFAFKKVNMTSLLQIMQPEDKVSIVEIGSGSGGTSEPVMEALLPFKDRVEFVYTDISTQLVGYGRRTYGPRFPFAQFRLLDVERDVKAQVPNFALTVASQSRHFVLSSFSQGTTLQAYCCCCSRGWMQTRSSCAVIRKNTCSL